VEVEIEYELGIADCSTTSVALIAQAMLDEGANLADINLADIEADPNFDDVMSAVTSAIEAGGDPTESAVIQQAVEDFLSPPAPSPAPAPAPTPIDIAAILGVTAPVTGATPVTTITATAQYEGTVTWAPVDNPFAGETVYTATITLTAKTGFTLAGVAADFFTVAGATTVTNAADSGVVTAVFPETAAAVIDIAAIPGVTAPVTGATPVTTITPTAQYTGTVTWSPGDNPFLESTAYTATITLTAKTGFTLAGVAADFFTVAGAVATNLIDSGIVTSVFPATATPITAIGAITGTAQVGVTLTAGALTPSGATATYQWQICDTSGGTYANISGATSTTYTPVADDVTKFIKVVATGTGSYSGTVTSAATAAVANGEQAAPTGLTGVAPTTYGGTDGKITGTTTAMEYKLSTEPTTWTTITVTEITDLAVGTYHVRYAAKAGFNAGTAADVVVPALAIGHSYGGGIVAYILQIGDPGYNADVQHGLIAATADQSTSCAWSNITNILIGTTGTSIGTGLANTTAIIGQSGHTDSAAKVCHDYSVTVSSVIYDDWFLPSRDELYQLYINQDKIGGFAIKDYWSSSESPYANHAWFQYFGGTQDFTDKYREYYVRAVRAF
jgi:hypothetical protein